MPRTLTPYHGNVRIYGIWATHNECFAGLKTKLAQLIVVSLAVLAQ